MPYGVVWKPAAEADFDAIVALNAIVASKVLDQIDRLAENSQALAGKPSFPHPLLPKYQFWVEDIDQQHHLYVTVLFRFAANALDIAIEFIGRSLVPKDYPLGP
jgi:Txe/YoeB family toxin of Txe-Axe toxin-antitoxin module